MRPAGRGRFFIAAAIMAAAAEMAGYAVDAQNIMVNCSSSQVHASLTLGDNTEFNCGDKLENFTTAEPNVSVNADVETMTLKLGSAQNLINLAVEGSNQRPSVKFSNPLNVTALDKLTILRFDSVVFGPDSFMLKLPGALIELHVVNSEAVDLSLSHDGFSPALKTINLTGTSFQKIPKILYELNYSAHANFIVDLSSLTSMTLNPTEYANMAANVGSDALNEACPSHPVLQSGNMSVECGSPSALSSSTSSSSSNSPDVGSDAIDANGSGSADTGDSSSGVSTGVLVVIIVLVVVIAAVLAFFILRMYMRRKATNANANNNEATATLMSKGDAAADKGSFISNDELLRNFRLPQSDVALVKSLGTGRLWMGEYNGNKVVVKRVESEVTDSYVTKALMAQARTFATISHPNITNLVGVTWLAGTDFAVVTEFMDKGNLKTVLANSDVDLDITTKLQMCCDVALGLAYLHETEQNLCAKQLSSRKVLVNKAMNCKLSLFECVPSSAKLGGPSGAVTYSYGMGEVAWLPPEVIRRSSPMDARKNNIYAFGVLVSEIFTRVSPYQSLVENLGNTMSDVELVKRVRREEQLVPHENRQEFLAAPASVQQMVEKCLSYAPMSRPTAKDLVEVLHLAKEELATNSI
ncbi:hypothetical protein V7S43_010973 [Phytophthora oleae]|uniref:Protein kinase domain-containing protein n=1 Tax=Phytophthora oleae TaxID=2107226 RepID=A0ABD3FDT0_9STRA